MRSISIFCWVGKSNHTLFHSHAQTFHILRRLIFTTFSSALSDITNHNILDKSGLIVTQFRGFTVTLWESQKYPNTEFFLVRISHIRSEYGKILRASPYSVRMRENTDQKKLRTSTIFTQYPPFPRTFFEWIYMNDFKMVVSEKIFVGKIFKTRKNYLPMSLFLIKMQVCMSLKRELHCSVLLLKHYLSVPLVPLLLFFKQSCFTFQYI